MKKILNILLGVILLITVILTVYAMVAGGSNEAINLNLIWSYILIAVGIATALFTAVWGMVNSSKGIKGTLLSTLLIVVIVAAAYLIARGYTIEIPDVANGGFFPHPETVITEASILVTYVALGAAVLTAIFTEIYKAFK